MSSIRELLLSGARRLSSRRRTASALESRLLLQAATGLSERDVLTSPEASVPAAAERRFARLVERRRGREPLACLTGEREFWSMPFRVGPGVLIPRPETETLVEQAIGRAPKNGALIVDMGTGCGNIAVALAREIPRARIFAVDRSRKALRTARGNAERLGAVSITFVEGDLFGPLAGLVRERTIDIVVSNPPYVSALEWPRLEPGVRHFEPKGALVAGATGLEVIRRLIRGARAYLKSGGSLLFEIGRGQADTARAALGPGWRDVDVVRDLAGVPRVVIAVKNGPAICGWS